MSDQPPETESADTDRSVTPFELFFDLVFVFAFTQVTQLLASDPSWVGLGQGILLISALWLTWQSYAWLGTRIDLGEGAVRLARSQFLAHSATPPSCSRRRMRLCACSR
jgi:low temperature requirement protein LtrA